MPNISNLNDPTFTTLIPDQVITSAEHNSWRTDQVVATIKNLNDVVADLENNYASTSEPGDKPEGKIFCNTTNDPAVLQFYKDGASNLYTLASLEAANIFTNDLTIAATKNLLLNGAAAPTALAGGIAMLIGTAPSGNLTNGIAVWSADIAADQAGLFVRSEGGHILSWGNAILDLNNGIANNDRTIKFASDASLVWDEDPGVFIFNRNISLNGTTALNENTTLATGKHLLGSTTSDLGATGARLQSLFVAAATITNTLTLSAVGSILSINGTTDSSAGGAGALVVAGGVYIAKNLRTVGFLASGVDDVTGGLLVLYGAVGDAGGTIRLYNGTGYDTTSEYWLVDSNLGSVRIATSLGSAAFLAAEGGAVTIYYSGAVKLVTTNTGISVTGDIAGSAGGNLLLNGAVVGNSLAGGFAMLNGTAEDTTIAGISAWAADQADGGAQLAESELVIMNEGLTKYHIGGGASADEDVRVGGSLPDAADFTTSTKAGAIGVLKSFTVPAGLLGVNGKALKVTAWGTKTGANTSAQIQVRTGTTPTDQEQIGIGAASGRFWSITYYLVRISSTAADMFIVANEQATGISDYSVASNLGTRKYNAITSDTNWAAAQTLDFNVSTINGGDTVTQEGMIVELLN